MILCTQNHVSSLQMIYIKFPSGPPGSRRGSCLLFHYTRLSMAKCWVFTPQVAELGPKKAPGRNFSILEYHFLTFALGSHSGVLGVEGLPPPQVLWSLQSVMGIWRAPRWRHTFPLASHRYDSHCALPPGVHDIFPPSFELLRSKD